TIVEAASRLFRARGIDAVSVGDIMGSLGLTVGGFYRHFASKDVLVAEAIEAASLETVSRRAAANTGLTREERATALVDAYLSRWHRDHADVGCVITALCSDVAREGAAAKDAFTAALQRLLSGISGLVPGESQLARDRRLRTVAALVGAVVLSRATSDQALAGNLLDAVRRDLVRAPRARTRARRRRSTKLA
ncbi:MAG: TetR/AcrR family transcriptional regulator, partial [Polyangiaceae bacterium]|nr:TetR/AcrR family transcriptional regulator [Polyangiaceae bacterium]